MATTEEAFETRGVCTGVLVDVHGRVFVGPGCSIDHVDFRTLHSSSSSSSLSRPPASPSCNDLVKVMSCTAAPHAKTCRVSGLIRGISAATRKVLARPPRVP